MNEMIKIRKRLLNRNKNMKVLLALFRFLKIYYSIRFEYYIASYL